MPRPTEYPPLAPQLILEYWDDFEQSEVEWVDGDAMRLLEALKSKYGISEDEAAHQLQGFLDTYETKLQRRG